jgi:hypothetical protein
VAGGAATVDARSGTPAPTRAALLATLLATAVAVSEFVRRGPAGAIDPGLAAPFLWIFTGLFLCRVAGQVLVRLRRPRWLPPTEEWNLTPYHVLLPVQLAILGLMAWIDASFSAGDGPPVHPRPNLGEGVLAFGYVYAGVMALRYAVRMWRRPEARWFGGAIPIVFHLVLAAYLFVFGSYHASY